MNIKPRFPRYLYLVSGLIGGILGILLVMLWLGFGYSEILGRYLDPLTFSDDERSFLLCCFFWPLTGGVGAVLGLILARISYSLKPRNLVIFIGAVLGGLAGAFLVSLLMVAVFYDTPTVPILRSDFQELTSVENYGSCEVSSDGSRLAVASEHRIRIWDLDEEAAIGEPLTYNYINVAVMALSPDGHTLAIGSADDSVTLQDVVTGEHLARLEGDAGSLNAVEFSPDGRQLASAYVSKGMEGVIDLWDVETGEYNTRLNSYDDTAGPIRMAYSPDGRLLASSQYGPIIMWDPKTGKEVTRLWEYDIKSLVFSPDSKIMAAIGMDDLILFWDTETRKPLGQLKPSLKWGLLDNLAFSPDGKMLAVESFSTVYLWDMLSQEPFGKINSPRDSNPGELAFLPDGRLLVCYSSLFEPGMIGIWTIESP